MISSSVERTGRVRRKSYKRMGYVIISMIVIISSIGTVGLATFVGWNLTHPVKVAPVNLPEKLGLSYEHVEFMSSDEIKLDGWLFPSKRPSSKLIIFAHGYANNRSHEVGALPTVKALNDAGYNCLMFDFRNSGLSEGSLTSIGLFEKIDLLSAVDYGKTRGYQQFGVIGFSMGAVTAILAASETPDIQALVLDSPFAALEPYLRDNLSVWSNLPNFPFTPLVIWTTPNLIGVDPDQVRPIDQMEKLRERGLLFIHARNDTSIPSRNSEELFAAVGDSNAELWLTDSSKHVGSYAVDPALYVSKVVTLFDQYMK
jgi:pimeloyl-ACP methyl ester carboxylesterase